MNAEQQKGTDTVPFNWETIREAYNARTNLTPSPEQAVNTLTVISAELKEVPFRIDDLIEDITKSVDSGDLAQVCTKLVQLRTEIARQSWAVGGLARVLAVAIIKQTEKSGEAK